MRVIVTGGAGFVGGAVAAAFLEAGWEVLVADDLSTGTAERVPAGAEFEQVDVASPAFSELVRRYRPDVISHQAAQASVTRSVADPLDDARRNVLGTVNVLRSAAEAGARRVVYASTGGAIYGECSAPAPEERAPDPSSPYGASKAAGELACRAFERSFGLEVTVLRYANVYGPGQRPDLEAGVVAIFAHAMLGGGTATIFGDGLQTRDFVYVDDVARANVVAAVAPRTGTYNVGTGRSTPVLELFRLLAEATGYGGEPVFAPARPGELRHSVVDPSKAARELGWRPEVTLEEGVRRVVDALRAG